METGLGGSCPVCRFGDVDHDKCDRCGAKFCTKCGGSVNRSYSPNVLPCTCKNKSKR